MGIVLRLGQKADLEVYEGTCDVSRHGYINVFSCIIPLQGHAEVEGTGSVDGGGILGVQRVVEVVEVGTGGRADAEVVDHESKGGVAGEVLEEATGTCLIVPVGLEVDVELLVCKYADLGQSVHPPPYLNHHVAFVADQGKVVLTDYLLGNLL